MKKFYIYSKNYYDYLILILFWPSLVLLKKEKDVSDVFYKTQFKFPTDFIFNVSEDGTNWFFRIRLLGFGIGLSFSK